MGEPRASHKRNEAAAGKDHNFRLHDLPRGKSSPRVTWGGSGVDIGGMSMSLDEHEVAALELRGMGHRAATNRSWSQIMKNGRRRFVRHFGDRLMYFS